MTPMPTLAGHGEPKRRAMTFELPTAGRGMGFIKANVDVTTEPLERWRRSPAWFARWPPGLVVEKLEGLRSPGIERLFPFGSRMRPGTVVGLWGRHLDESTSTTCPHPTPLSVRVEAGPERHTVRWNSRNEVTTIGPLSRGSSASGSGRGIIRGAKSGQRAGPEGLSIRTSDAWRGWLLARRFHGGWA